MRIGVPRGSIRRLTEHYGSDVGPWLATAETVVSTAAQRWQVSLEGFHDAGWTSVIGVGTDRTNRRVLIKALPEAARYRQERAALTAWREAPVCRLAASDNELQALLIEAVAGQAGGGPRPADHEHRIAEVLSQLHQATAPRDGAVPALVDYYRGTVTQRVERRGRRFGDHLGDRAVDRCLDLCERLSRQSNRPVLLHSDLYAENVLFDPQGRPVFIDPHAKIGSAAFDWAFWCVYYQVNSGFAERLALCHEQVPAEFDEVVAWSLTLLVDGALYYLDTEDHTAQVLVTNLQVEPVCRLLRNR